MITLSPQSRRLLSLLYVAALVIVLDQGLDLVATVWPLRPSFVNWRVGTFGLGTNRLEFLALADAMAVVAAIYLDHRRVLVGLAALHLFLGLFLAAGLALFILDALQVRRLVRPERVRELDVAALRTLVLGGSACLACFAVTIGVWRTRRIRREGEKPQEGLLMVGASKGAGDE